MTDALMVTSSFLPGRGGIESYLSELCAHLRPRLAVLAPGQRDGHSLPSDLGYPTHAGPGSMLVPNAAVVRAIAATATAESTEKILFGTPWPLALVGPRLERHGLRYAVIVHASEMLVPAAVPIVGARLATALSRAEVLFAVSDFTAGQISAFLEKRRLTTPPIERLRARVDVERFHPDVDIREVRNRLGIPPDEHVVLCFGRLVRRKGVHRLLAVADAIAEAAGPTAIVIAGTGPEERRLRRLARTRTARVVFVGRVAEEDAAAVYASADVFALPVVDRYRGLETEGLGVVLLEAAACGVPCVTGRSGGTPEAILDGVTGLVIDARSADRLSGAIVRLLRDKATATAMGRAGREHVLQNFSVDRVPEPLLRWLDG